MAGDSKFYIELIELFFFVSEPIFLEPKKLHSLARNYPKFRICTAFYSERAGPRMLLTRSLVVG